MKNLNIFTVIFVLVFMCSESFGQETATVTKTEEVTLQIPADISKTLGLFMFPANNQDADQQHEDQKACYVWAYEQTGWDPMNPTKVPVKKAQTNQGGAVKGAAKGAAAGAAIGAVTGDAGDGAAIGAVAGAMGGIRARRQAQAQAEQKAKQEASAQEQEYKTNFTKAFSACIEAKGYTVN
jgi:hypothetical protein